MDQQAGIIRTTRAARPPRSSTMSELPPSPWGVLAEELEQDLSTPLAESLNHPLVTPLSDTAALRIQGQRWREFLKGQLNCDEREARPGQALYVAICPTLGLL